MQQDVVVYMTGIHPAVNAFALGQFLKYYTGDVSRIEMFTHSSSNIQYANITMRTLPSAIKVIDAVNYKEFNGLLVHANLAGYEYIERQNSERGSVFISGGNFANERDLFEELSKYGPVMRVKLLRGCAIGQFYFDEHADNIVGKVVRYGVVSKKTDPKKKQIEVQKKEISMKKPQIEISNKKHHKKNIETSYKSNDNISQTSNGSVKYVKRESVGVFSIRIGRQNSISAL